VSFLTQRKTDGANELQLSGNVMNLLATDIVMMAGGVNSTLESGGGITWGGSGKPCRLTQIGKLNSFFTLCEPGEKIDPKEAERVLNRMPGYRRKRYDAELARARTGKGRPTTYYLVSRAAAVVAYASGRSIRNLLVPVGGTRAVRGTGKKLPAQYVGFVPAWLMFED